MKHPMKIWCAALSMLAATLCAPAFAQLGTLDKELTYTPIAPCRIADTRIAGGALVAGVERAIDVTAVSSYSFQGGDSGNCVIGAAGSIAAVAAIITVYNPNASGTLKAYPYLTTAPTAAIAMAYAAGEVRSNFTVVKLDQGASANELNLLSSAQANVTIDVVGYYDAPTATTPQCVNTTVQSNALAASTVNFFNNPACPAGYTAITPYCYANASGVYSQGSGYNANGAGNQTFCAWQNTAPTAVLVYGGNVCCRVPGR